MDSLMQINEHLYYWVEAQSIKYHTYWASIELTFLIQVNILTPVSTVVLFIDKHGSILTAWLITWTES